MFLHHLYLSSVCLSLCLRLISPSVFPPLPLLLSLRGLYCSCLSSPPTPSLFFYSSICPALYISSAISFFLSFPLSLSLIISPLNDCWVPTNYLLPIEFTQNLWKHTNVCIYIDLKPWQVGHVFVGKGIVTENKSLDNLEVNVIESHVICRKNERRGLWGCWRCGGGGQWLVGSCGRQLKIQMGGEEESLCLSGIWSWSNKGNNCSTLFSVW